MPRAKRQLELDQPEAAEKAGPALAPSFAPSFEGDFQFTEDLLLDSGRVLRRPLLHYATYGKLNRAGDNAVLVPHALSGSALVTTWWPQLFGSDGLLDLDRDFIIGINFFGSCYGSTGPASIDPDTGKLYGAEFPLISIRDIVRSQARLLDHLGVSRLRLVIGASIGGMQAIEWAITYPKKVATVVSIAAAPLGAMGLALNHLQRQIIQLDPHWNGGRYSPLSPPANGLALARGLGVCSYKSADLFTERFARKPDRSGEDPWIDSLGTDSGGIGSQTSNRFDVAGFLDYQGAKFVDRFDANSYLAITRTMDTFDPLRGRGSPHAVYGSIEASVVMVGISSDWLFPPEDVRRLAEEIEAAGARCEYREVATSHGHDAFLAEPEHLSRILRPLLSP